MCGDQISYAYMRRLAMTYSNMWLSRHQDTGIDIGPASTTGASDGASSSFVRPKVPAFREKYRVRRVRRRSTARQFDMCPMRVEKRHAVVGIA
jgi:hypothetical protein